MHTGKNIAFGLNGHFLSIPCYFPVPLKDFLCCCMYCPTLGLWTHAFFIDCGVPFPTHSDSPDCLPVFMFYYLFVLPLPPSHLPIPYYTSLTQTFPYHLWLPCVGFTPRYLPMPSQAPDLPTHPTCAPFPLLLFFPTGGAVADGPSPTLGSPSPGTPLYVCVF